MIALSAYVLISILSLGIMAQPELAGLKNPSMAGVLEQVVGPWGAALISLGLIVSVAGAFLSWTLLAAEIPFVAAKEGILPKLFAGETASGSTSSALWITNGLVQLFLIVTLFAESTYEALFYTASTAILVPYVFSGAYALKLAWSGETYDRQPGRTRDIIIGLIATVYGIWLVCAAGPAYLLMCALLYAPGIFFYFKAKRERQVTAFTRTETLLAIGLIVAALIAAWLIYQGAISPL